MSFNDIVCGGQCPYCGLRVGHSNDCTLTKNPFKEPDFNYYKEKYDDVDKKIKDFEKVRDSYLEEMQKLCLHKNLTAHEDHDGTTFNICDDCKKTF